MEKQPTRYIVKRSYATSRTGTEAFVKLIKKAKSRSEYSDDEDINIEQTKHNIEKDKSMCYTKDSFRESCVIPKNPKEE